MMSWFVPKETQFFNLFSTTAKLIVDGAQEMAKMLDDLSNVPTYSKKIKSIEQEADKVSYQSIQALHATFITPLDRDDMYKLIGKMDDIMDYINAVSQRFELFDIRSINPEIRQLTQIIVDCALKIQKAVASLENMKASKMILETCAEINRLESDADHIMRIGLSKLFREDINYKEFIKMKEVTELLESVTDRCKEVSNIVEGIVLDHA